MANDNDNDNDNDQGTKQRTVVDLSEPGALEYWCNVLGCPSGVLVEACASAGGNSVEIIRGEIGVVLQRRAEAEANASRQRRRQEPDDFSP